MSLSDEDIATRVQKWIAKFQPLMHPKDIENGVKLYLKNAPWFTQMSDTEKTCLVKRVVCTIRKQWAKKAKKTKKTKKQNARREEVRKKQLSLL